MSRRYVPISASVPSELFDAVQTEAKNRFGGEEGPVSVLVREAITEYLAKTNKAPSYDEVAIVTDWDRSMEEARRSVPLPLKPIIKVEDIASKMMNRMPPSVRNVTVDQLLLILRRHGRIR